MAPAVIIQKLSVVLGKNYKALDDITVSLPTGKIMGFIGPSGAGKTTLIRSIVGRQKLSAGSIEIFDIPAGSAALREQVSYMTQESSVYGDLTVKDNLDYFAIMLGISSKARAKAVADVLVSIDMTSRATLLVDKLSGGQRQRVSLGISLLGTPKLLVLDEPTVGLDPVLREQLWELFRSLAAGGTTIIISSHVMDEAEKCDELVLIRDGKLLAQGTPRQLTERTNSRTVEESFLKLVKDTL